MRKVIILQVCLVLTAQNFPPLLIFKRKTLPKDKISAGIPIHVHQKGWMDESDVKLWGKKVWARRPGG